jgi:hypothetical protein
MSYEAFALADSVFLRDPPRQAASYIFQTSCSLTAAFEPGQDRFSTLFKVNIVADDDDDELQSGNCHRRYCSIPPMLLQ